MTVGAERIHIHVSDVRGKFQRLHRISGWILLAILFLTPYLEVAGRPFFRLDLGARKFYLLSGVFTPRDTVLVFGLLLSAALLLFFFTSLYGRLWCGFACPQTVFLEEIIRPIERWVDGNRGARRKLMDGPWNQRKLTRRALKWFLFAIVAAVAAVHTGGLFVDIIDLWTGKAARGDYVFVAFVGVLLFIDFAWFREQFCNYLCPYARFQGVMVDDQSLVVGYHSVRGEPRREKGVRRPKAELGDCVGCNLCVTTCPAGIDIREGFQLECISCARCIDACTGVMAKQDLPSLIDFTSLNELENKPSRAFRLRPVIYGVLLVVVSVGMAAVLATRDSYEFTIAQPPGAAELVRDDGRVQNLYQVTVFNNGGDTATFRIEIEGIEGAEVVVPGGAIEIEPASQRLVPAFVIAPSGLRRGNVVPFEFVVTSDGREVRRPAIFRNQLLVSSR